MRAKNKAFTVAELIVASVIMVSLVGILVAGFSQNYAAFQSSNIVNSFQNDARLAALQISKDLRRTNLSKLSITKNTPWAGTDSITYKLPSADANNDPVISGGSIQWDSNSITIAVDAANAGELVRSGPDGTRALAHNIKAITFTSINQSNQLYLDELKVGLHFEALGFRGRKHNFNSTFIVDMRN